MKILKDTEVLANCDTSFLLRKTYLKFCKRSIGGTLVDLPIFLDN